MMKKPPHPANNCFYKRRETERKDELAAPINPEQSPIPSDPTPFTACSAQEQPVLCVAQSSFFMGQKDGRECAGKTELSPVLHHSKL